MSTTGQVEPTPTDKLWTPANIVTLVRICLVPVFVVALLSPWPQWFGLPQVADDSKSLIAAGIFILISCTDWLDGYLARSRGEVTDFGKFMDPLADKILVAAALLALVELGSLPSWVVLVILAREFIVSGVRMVAASEGVVIAASWYGKFKTVFQMIAIVLFCVKDSYMVGSIGAAFSDWLWLLSWAVMIVALVLTIVSMLDYIAKARHLIGFGPKGGKKVAGGSASPVADVQEHGAAGVGVSEADPGLEGLAAEVIAAARAAGATVGTAESLTGGLIAGALTGVPGSSEVVRGGVVSYVNEVKHGLLGVPSQTLECEGAVSAQTARAMAEGARRDLGCDMAIAVTGIAGPGGAEPGKPVGTVWVGFADGAQTEAQLYEFSGDRAQVRAQTVCVALERLLAAFEPAERA
ncbi:MULTISPECIES: CDP-diacylglycerol--glycerol-3-phosphate 3-phosphatidyltransferase [Gordonibacter]|uniref:CDP-diacylglycerol--glycerol-3-phosphate 3-phosphatidyltransferase n=1 Tax=Gordonibacter faecis TaxID=3047475 RepID=A0ABT7DIF9_9ACTN|nr:MULTISPECIES: CDP-diacylglycerol--glycerol-3-phosphate 3-phosphatidyltransferase [unclassified Gordonibacter]MDJ1649313.1 CDP-diacylglycerol--glycerol-3-phosphate 3-phosphatidyltransferase [Gordonibacter sp. KGMB12511]HIW75220.1 CDP-diacylglycerol--glycerol-3-phosphate 3-phosphatidyltransferase [Candidatus Gordonibacter avicola]